MSHKVTPLAFDTRLGNSSAKSVLFCLADIGNETGFGFPSVETIAANTELSVRQVLRIVQIFEEIGLVQRKRKVTVDDRILKYAFQLNVGLLGTDLRVQFSASFAKVRGGKCPKDSVPGTAKGVPGTQKSVPGTEPPHPLIGGTANEPPTEPSSPAAQSKGPKKEKTPDPRHIPFKEVLGAYWKSKNPALEMPWGKPEAGALGMVLSASPDLTAEQFRHLLHNRWKSEVNHSDRPSQWLHKVLSYGNGPVDRFGNTLSTNGGNRNGSRYRSQSERTVENIEAAAQAVAARHGFGSDGSQPGSESEFEGSGALRGEVVSSA